MELDLVIRNGTVIDGTAGPRQSIDVGIANGRIAALDTDLSGDEIIDARDHIVAPGFIDIHTHFDAQVFWDPSLTPSSHHGVTSVIAGNCGFGIAPLRPGHRDLITGTLENVEDMDPASLIEGVDWSYETFTEYLEAVERRTTLLNFGVYAGHTPIRLYVMADDAYERQATDEEIAQMVALVDDALDAGAVGFATSFGPTHLGIDGKPVPSRHASEAEFVALASCVGRRGQGVVGIVPGGEINRARLYELQPVIGAPITYGALLTRPDGSHLDELRLNEAGWEGGARVWPQVTPRPIAFAISMAEPFLFNPNPVVASLMAGSAAERRAAYADPAWRARAWEGFPALGRLEPRWDSIEIAESKTRPDVTGRRLAQLASDGETPFDAVCRLAVDDDLDTRIRVVVANDDVDGVATLLHADGCTLGLSDAGAHVSQICDAAQATEYLGTWVRDRSLLSWEEGIHRLTGRQADLFGFADRGLLEVGAAADITVFDPDTIAPGPVRRVHDFPAGAERLTAEEPQGVEHVLVNGVPIRRAGEALDLGDGARPGQRLRPS